MGSLLISWAAFLFYPPFARSSVRSEESSYSAAFPHPSVREGLGSGKSLAVASAFSQFLPIEVQTVRPLEDLLNRRAKASYRVLPVFLLSITGSILAALLVRERLR